MLGSIAAALVGIWFYNTAARSSRPPISWAVSGVVVYFLAALLWTLAITPSVKDAASHSQSAALIFIVRYAYIGFGVLVAVLLNGWLNKSTDSE
ncbi:hypothetical protein JWZ98_14290 [Methylomonas sp. EFPC1]|uniref:hypothetical protein n=1 Tax=Methylomonas sp. EFPC1 TaxID=2812647 RepID=UPI001966FCB4|nr:hypothetical protein [Methylomonas sp. EFPC1]QSA99852.1 hypothetical protein JWZ98_14290 [Methylomonas sp. EFPC1]